MQVSKIARTHLVYQFIIVALLLLCIGYYEFLLDKKFIFILALAPMFFYQLATLSCYTELFPIAHCLNLSEILFGTSLSRTERKINDSSETGIIEPQEPKEHPAENFIPMDENTITSIRTANNETRAPKQRIYKFRDWQTNCFPTTKAAETSPSAFTSSVSSVKKPQKFTLASAENRLQDSELTKIYFFPYRQKRLEEWIDSKGNGRPYKIRSREPNIEENVELDSQSTSNTSLMKTPKHIEMSTVEESELRKSYSYPFRQKRQLGETSEASNKSTMSHWQNVEGFVSDKQKCLRRRSVSISSLNNQELNFINNDHREFSQSLEISDSSHAENSNLKRSSSKASNVGFNKIKMGILNCFSKMKKENSKINFNRKETYHKRSSRSFQPKENLQSLELDDDYVSLKSSGEIRKHSNIYPGYTPFVKRSFLTL